MHRVETKFNSEWKSTQCHLQCFLVVQLDKLRRIPSVMVTTKLTLAWKLCFGEEICVGCFRILGAV